MFSPCWAPPHRPLVPSVRLFALLMVLISTGAGDVFTSTQKILDLAASEGDLLESLEKFIAAEHENLDKLKRFVSERQERSRQPPEVSGQTATHPNGAYHLIHFFNHHWHSLVQSRPGLGVFVNQTGLDLPTDEDYKGALSSLIRLQHVYQLSVADMYAGNYLGHVGPALRPADTYLLGRQAFVDGLLPECIHWLQFSVRLLQEQGGTFPATFGSSGGQFSPAVTLSQAASLLGRAYIYMNENEKAQEMYDLASATEPKGGDAVALKKELAGSKVGYGHKNKTWDHNMTVLCLRPKHHTVPKILPIHVCRYKRAFGLSYLTYKEEILSIQPYVSLFYDVIRDHDMTALQDHVKGKMVRGRVGDAQNRRIDSVRTSDIGWIYDHKLKAAGRMSQRIKFITGLEVDQREPEGPASSEAFQVVNYGLGGHYGAHFDPFTGKEGDGALKNAGSRIATFLMYLSDVELGGSTVFLRAGISVAPRKGMSLFWYNFSPDMDKVDQLTEHAGCPVVIGQKWIANKWIRTYGNTFLRPCGPRANSTQLQVESLLVPPPSV